MREGERMSAEVYNRHLQKLYNLYERQNDISNYSAFFNPVIGIKNISMVLSGTDFTAYRKFQEDTEAYRYKLAQTMNELQIKHIPNSKPSKDEQPHAIGREHWTEFADFSHGFQSIPSLIKSASLTIAASLVWLLFSFILIYLTAGKAKAL
jgi:ABC-2 type transport system permease protein